ncbi:MAG: lipoyl(octanoyl) transferase LipB [Chloroflexi bacterium]|nr:MAG: lipoyl(octanoyl) transferase LipB [Chloroflexota bacterium]
MSKPVPWSVPHITLMSKSRRVRACWLGSVPYRKAWDLQGELVAAVRDGRVPDTLLLLEHPHVFTMGKAATADHLLWDEDERARRGVDVVWSDRGGEATYHGPGQLVGYPILDLTHFGITIPEYLQGLERSLIDYLAEVGVVSAPGERGLTGVWSGGEKVAAIGIKLNRPVVSHGFALNLTTDLGYFDGIIPCGHAEKRPTSVAALTGRRIDAETAATAYASYFERVFAAGLEWTAADSLVASLTAGAGAGPHI